MSLQLIVNNGKHEPAEPEDHVISFEEMRMLALRRLQIGMLKTSSTKEGSSTGYDTPGR